MIKGDIMKALYFLFITFSLNAFASGTLMVEPGYDWERGRTHYSVGLGVYETLTKSIAYSSWSGMGNSVLDEKDSYHSWAVSKHSIDIKALEKLTVSPGVKLNYLDDRELGDKKRLYGEVILKIAYKLW